MRPEPCKVQGCPALYVVQGGLQIADFELENTFIFPVGGCRLGALRGNGEPATGNISFLVNLRHLSALKAFKALIL